jgi:hypothetical protein
MYCLAHRGVATVKLDRSQHKRPRQGVQIAEWIMVTAILTLAVYIILQVLGGSIDPLWREAIDLWRRLVQTG